MAMVESSQSFSLEEPKPSSENVSKYILKLAGKGKNNRSDSEKGALFK